MADGKLPFAEPDIQKTMNKILFSTPTFPESFPPELVDLISRMLTKLPDQRITLDDIKKHTWFSPREYSNIQIFVERSSSFTFSPQDIYDCEQYGIVPASLRQSLSGRLFNEETAISRIIKRKKLLHEIVSNSSHHHNRYRADSYNTNKPAPVDSCTLQNAKPAPMVIPAQKTRPISPTPDPMPVTMKTTENPRIIKHPSRQRRIRGFSTNLLPPNLFM